MTTSTQTITQFLLDRIAEDLAPRRVAAWHESFCMDPSDVSDGLCTYCGAAEDRARFREVAPSPRVLAECEAKRRIVEQHSRSGVTCPRCSLGMEDGEIVFERDPCRTLRALAAVYADHPDWREEWRP